MTAPTTIDGAMMLKDLEELRCTLKNASSMSDYGDAIEMLQDLIDTVSASKPVAPIDMLLFCQKCGTQHIDAVEETLVWSCGPVREPSHEEVTWENPPHRSHLCHTCGTIWRPADVPTNGVARIVTKGKADTWPLAPSAEAAAPAQSGERVTPAELKTAIETLRHVIECLRKNGSYTDEEGEATDYLEPLLSATPQPAQTPQVASQDDERAANTLTIKVEKDHFDRLMDALDRAERKGFMPDAIASEWSVFEWEIVPPRMPHVPDMAADLGLNQFEARAAAPQSAQTERPLPKVHGISRMVDNPCVLMLLLMREPTDDDLRAIHDRLTAAQPASGVDHD